MNITTKAQRLEAGDSFTEGALEVLHWAERYRRTSSGLDYQSLVEGIDKWVTEDALYPGDIVFHEDRPGVPNTLLKIDDNGEIELVTPAGHVLLGSARHLTPTGLRAPQLGGMNTSYMYNGKTGEIVARSSQGAPDVEFAHAARFVNGHVQILVGPYWVAPYYKEIK